LAVCSVTSLVFLLRKMRKNISGFKVNARGIRRDTHPTLLTRIYLEFILNTTDTADTDIKQALKLTEETYCPVWAMLKNNVEVIAEYKIVG